MTVVISTLAWAGTDALVLACSLYSDEDDDLEVQLFFPVLPMLSRHHVSIEVFVRPQDSLPHLRHVSSNGNGRQYMIGFA